MDASSGQLGARGLNKAQGERTCQGRGATMRTTHSFAFGQSEFFLLFFTLLTFSPLTAHTASVTSPDFALVPGVNLSAYDETIQQAAFSAFTKLSAQTGKIFQPTLSGALSNVSVYAVRLRVGSLRRYGLTVGAVKVSPGLKVLDPNFHVIVIYRNFGSLPVFTSPVLGQSFVSPVVGIRVYNGHNLNTVGPLPSLGVTVLEDAIQINISSSATPSYCVTFNSNGTTTTTNVSSVPYVCTARVFGDYCLLGLATPTVPPSPGPIPVVTKIAGKSNNAWKIVVGTVLGALGLLAILSLLACVVFRYRRRRRFAKMQFQTDQGETLRSNFIGNSRAPAAPGTRTRPTLEADHLES